MTTFNETSLALPGALDGKESACSVGGQDFIPGQEDPLEKKCYPLQYSCLENPTERGAWWATDHGVTKSQTRLGD